MFAISRKKLEARRETEKLPLEVEKWKNARVYKRNF
jgi:hypothetical protein